MSDKAHNYYVTWKTFVDYSGSNMEGWLLICEPREITQEILDEWKESILKEVPNRSGKGLIISGIFKIN